MGIERLFAPLTVNGMTLRNRFVMPAMQRGKGIDGRPSAELADIYCQRAAGGVALIISESTSVDHPSAHWQAMLCRLDDETAPSWAALCRQVQQAGARFFMQLWHPGAMRTVAQDSPHAAQPSLSPSGLVQAGRPNGRAMTGSELDEIRDAFVRSALHARQMGADGVEVHACHGYLLDQFLWAETNRRPDGYGGDAMADRVRYPAEIVRAIRSAVGDDFPISFRFSQWKEVDYGARIAATPDELEIMVRALRAAGIDLFNVSTRRFYAPAWAGSSLTLAGWVKTMTDAPVIACGSVGLTADIMEDLFDRRASASDLPQTLERLDEIFAAREFDMIAVGRSQIADPEWVNKIRAGLYDEIITFDRDAMLGAVLEEYDPGLVEEHRVVTDKS